MCDLKTLKWQIMHKFFKEIFVRMLVNFYSGINILFSILLKKYCTKKTSTNQILGGKADCNFSSFPYLLVIDLFNKIVDLHCVMFT